MRFYNILLGEYTELISEYCYKLLEIVETIYYWLIIAILGFINLKKPLSPRANFYDVLRSSDIIHYIVLLTNSR